MGGVCTRLPYLVTAAISALGRGVPLLSGSPPVGQVPRDLDCVEGALVAAALEHVVAPIIESVEELLWEMPPDLADSVVRHKGQLAGGGALLLGLASRLHAATGITTVVVDDPLRSVVRGAATLLERHFDLLAPT